MSICFNNAINTSTTMLLPDCLYVSVSETTILNELSNPIKRKHSLGVSFLKRPILESISSDEAFIIRAILVSEQSRAYFSG